MRFTLICVVLTILAGCSKSSDPQLSKPVPAIQGAGATFPAPLYNKWIEEYQQAFPGREVNYDVVGSGEGVDRFLAESVDFGASDAALSDEEIARVERGAVLIPVTAGSLVIAYNLPNLGGELQLSRDVYVDIFLGEITKWNDGRIQADNPGLILPNLDIVVVARRDGSGTTFAFTNHLSAVSEKWRADGPGTGKMVDWPGSAMLANGNEGVAGEIKRSPGTIGYVQYGIAERLGLPMAALENKARNFVAPDGNSGLATLVDAKLPANLRAFFSDPDGEHAYPIVTLTWLLLYDEYGNAEKMNAVKHFVDWCLQNGQKFSESLGYIRLAPQQVSAARKALARIKAR